MFTNTPNSTPIWVFIIYSAISVFGIPKIKRLVSKYVHEEQMQKFVTFIIWMVLAVVIVTLSVVLFP